jgi:predicted Fe-Mo cluster-binding NifX family protein
MAFPASTLPEESRRTALLVMHSDREMALCPFFGKCDGVLVIDPHEKSQEFHANEQHTAMAICDLILKTDAGRLVCGFVGEPEKQRLRAAGIDVRLGSCACAVEDLAAAFDDLPRA